MKNFIDRRRKLKEKYKALYLKGYGKSQTEMKEKIKSMKIKHAHAIRAKDQMILNQKNELQRIKEDLNQHSQLIARTKSVLARVRNDSYVKNIICNEDHSRVEKYLDEIEINEAQFGKCHSKTEKKVLKFERIES